LKPEDLRRYSIKTYSELYEYIDKRLRSVSIPRTSRKDKLFAFKQLMLVKLETVYNILSSEVSNVISLLNDINRMHSFYKDVFKLETNTDIDVLKKIMTGILRNAKRIYSEYRDLIKNSDDPAEIKQYFRQSVGRLLSLYKRRDRLFSSVKKGLIELCKLPDVSGDFNVIISGMPQVGKSTLLSKLTRAKPEISPFPFTTKTVITGHIIVEPYGRITIIDTPGLLDRPLEERNIIEMKAILAIKHLADMILYVFDVNPHSYYMFDEQLKVFESIRREMSGVEFMVLINKIDITPGDRLAWVVDYLEKNYGLKPLPVSAMRGDNIDKLRAFIIEKFMEKIQHHLQ